MQRRQDPLRDAPAVLGRRRRPRACGRRPLGLSGHTDDYWSWSITADLSQIFMGAGYGAGATSSHARLSHRAGTRLGRRPVGRVLRRGHLVVTMGPLGRVQPRRRSVRAAFAFYGWVIVYGAAPFVVGGLWLDTSAPIRATGAGEPIVSAGRLAARGRRSAWRDRAGAPALAEPGGRSRAVGADLATTRALAGYVAQVAFGALLVSREERWGSWRLLLQAFLVATALLLVGVARAWGDRDGRVRWIFLGGLVGMALAMLALYRRMESAGGASAPLPARGSAGRP